MDPMVIKSDSYTNKIRFFTHNHNKLTTTPSINSLFLSRDPFPFMYHTRCTSKFSRKINKLQQNKFSKE
ncbi:hypothetical protein Ahy_A06g030167 isoform C [Arachis hypogaea]|uniref:Uncharacterized protein n=1 Tax=Arachis hypogaea TaxID=3818 RepID=A0A445CVF0_ARAHY|nr:hypothetical protein Ahy_A06g030167 isoform C [Arachis hypogaea]